MAFKPGANQVYTLASEVGFIVMFRIGKSTIGVRRPHARVAVAIIAGEVHDRRAYASEAAHQGQRLGHVRDLLGERFRPSGLSITTQRVHSVPLENRIA